MSVVSGECSTSAEDTRVLQRKFRAGTELGGSELRAFDHCEESLTHHSLRKINNYLVWFCSSQSSVLTCYFLNMKTALIREVEEEMEHSSKEKRQDQPRRGGDWSKVETQEGTILTSYSRFEEPNQSTPYHSPYVHYVNAAVPQLP
jgi:hypothetical protein